MVQLSWSHDEFTIIFLCNLELNIKALDSFQYAVMTLIFEIKNNKINHIIIKMLWNLDILLDLDNFES